MAWPGRGSALVAGALGVVGIWDMLQKRKTLRRNFPIVAHVRYLFEAIRPMMRQYVVEGDNDEVPFSHDQRSIVYQRAKQALETRPFGTERSLYEANYEWINHSMMPSTDRQPRLPRADRWRAMREAVFGQRVQHLGDEFRLAVAERDPRAQRGRATAAASTTTPAKVRCRTTTARMAATWSGNSARATSAPANAPASSARRSSPNAPCSTRSR